VKSTSSKLIFCFLAGSITVNIQSKVIFVIDTALGDKEIVKIQDKTIDTDSLNPYGKLRVIETPISCISL